MLLHGFLETSKIWEPFINQLSLRRQVICIDLPGHGKTGIFGDVHTMELMADVVNAVLTELNISRATILGHSMGGYVSLAFAEKYPEKISGIVLLNSTPEADSEEKRINRDKAARLVSKNKMAYRFWYLWACRLTVFSSWSRLVLSPGTSTTTFLSPWVVTAASVQRMREVLQIRVPALADAPLLGDEWDTPLEWLDSMVLRGMKAMPPTIRSYAAAILLAS